MTDFQMITIIGTQAGFFAILISSVIGIYFFLIRQMNVVEGRLRQEIRDSEDRLGARVEGVERRVEGVERRIEGVERRMNTIDSDIKILINDVGMLKGQAGLTETAREREPAGTSG